MNRTNDSSEMRVWTSGGLVWPSIDEDTLKNTNHILNLSKAQTAITIRTAEFIFVDDTVVISLTVMKKRRRITADISGRRPRAYMIVRHSDPMRCPLSAIKIVPEIVPRIKIKQQQKPSSAIRIHAEAPLQSPKRP